MSRAHMQALWRSVGAVAAWIALAAPTCRSTVPEVLLIEPPRGLIDRTTHLVIEGQQLDPDQIEQGPDVVGIAWTGTVGQRPLVAVRQVSPSRIEADVPPGLPPDVYDVILTSGERRVRVVGGFTAVAPVAPILSAIEPRSLPLQGGAMRLMGVGFHLGTSVKIAGVDAPARWVDDRLLEVTAPPSSGGPASIEVLTPVGRAVRTDLLTYD